MRHAKTTPMTQQAEMIQPASFQPLAWAATQAPSGGPPNCPRVDHFQIQPTVVDMASVLGASLLAEPESIAEINPPALVKTTTQAYCSRREAVALKASKTPTAIVEKPVANRLNSG